ncbi:hypothetical protein D3C77_470460 [compost metagenome]
MTHRLASAQAQRASGFALPLGNRLHTGADDFGHVRAGKQCQCSHPGELAGQVEHGADEEVENEDLYQQWRAAHQLDVDRGQVTQGRVVRQAAEAGKQTDHQAQHARGHRDPDRGPQAPGQRPGSPVMGHADQVAFGNIVATGQQHTGQLDVEHLLGTALVTQDDTCHVTFGGNRFDGAIVAGALGDFGLVGEVLRYPVPAPLVGNHRGRVIQAQRQAHQDQRGQPVPGPLGFLVFDHLRVLP